MGQVLRFPTPDRRTDAVLCARQIIRSSAPHDDETLRLACSTLQTFGDSLDWVDAHHVLTAIRRREKTRAEVAGRRGTIRSALLDCVGLAVILAAALAVYLAGGV